MLNIRDSALVGAFVIKQMGSEMRELSAQQAYDLMEKNDRIMQNIFASVRLESGARSVEELSAHPHFYKWVRSHLEAYWRWGTWALNGFNVFDLTTSLACALVLTEPAPFDAEELKLPFPAFCIRLPSGIFPITADGSEYWAREIWVHTFEAEGAEILQLCIGTDDDAANRPGVELYKRRPLSDLYGKVDILQDLNPKESVGPLHVDNPDRVFDVATHFIRNLCAWLESVGGLSGRRPQNVPRNKSRSREDIRPTFWSIGHEVKLSRELRDAAKLVVAGESSNPAGWRLRVQFIVRGHWRNQVHGPGRSLRRRQWIEPFLKGPVDGEAWAHLYKAKDTPT